MTSTFTIHHQGDVYEVKLHGYVIARITCYLGGQHRQDVQYDDAPRDVQEKILDQVEKVLNDL